MRTGLTRRHTLLGLGALLPGLAARANGTAPLAQRLVEAARAQIGVTTDYDGSYRRLAYPMGDVPVGTGVCTDVIVRAYRAAFGFDLQVAVHEDMAAAFPAYPAIWGLTGPDRNIDHRRVPNLETFLARRGAERAPTDWQAGDLFTGRLANNRPHIAVVSGRRTFLGREPYLVHNIGRGTEESALMGLFRDWRRFRFLPEAVGPGAHQR